MNEKGAVLPSVMVFVFLLVIILLGSVKIYQDQIHQLTGTREAYKAKTMLQLTEQELMARLENDEAIHSGEAKFDVGRVAIQKKSAEYYQIKVTTNTGFTLQKEVEYVVKEKGTEDMSSKESTKENTLKKKSTDEVDSP